MFKISLNCKDKKFRSNRLEFQPSFIVKLLFFTVLQWRGACFREQSKFFKSGNLLVIYFDELSIYKWTEFWNIKGHFPESWGLWASVSSSPLSLTFHFLCSCSNFRAITHLVTLATQATSIGEVPKTEPITFKSPGDQTSTNWTPPPLPQLQSNPALWTPA